jgi:mono/diheme cytochrome c family protein
VRRWLIFGVAVAAWLAASTAAMAADAAPNFTPSLTAGKRIYQTGLQAPGRAALSCSACHGRTGRGKLEAGVQIPPIAFDALTAPGSNSSGSRSAYDEASLRRAVTEGIGASGQPLGAVMPRHPLTDAQWSDLYRYLAMLGSSEDRDPGVGEQVLRIGTVLPLTGPSAAIGTGVRAAIEATFAEVNSQGGIFGRQLALVVEDGGSDRHRQLKALRRVLQTDDSAHDGEHAAGVFALVGAMLQPDDPEVAALLADSRVPLIGPLAHTPDAAVPSATYYLLPSLLEQTTALLANVLDSVGASPSPRLALLHDGSARSRSLLDLMAGWLKTRGVEVVVRADISSMPDRSASELSDERIDACLYLGDINPLLEHGACFASRSKREQRFPIAAHAGWLGPRVMELPPSMTDRLVLVRAETSPDAAQSARRGGPEVLAVTAAQVVVEGVRRSARRIDRETFTGHLDRLRDFRLATWPAITFSPPERIGNHRVVIVRFDRRSGALVGDGFARRP